MKKVIIFILILLLPVGFTTYAQQQNVPEKIDYKWAHDKISNREKYELMEMNNKISLYYAQETLEDYNMIFDPIYHAYTPIARMNNMLILKYGIKEQEERIKHISDNIQNTLNSDLISVRNSLYNVYNSKKNIYYNERDLYFAKKALYKAEQYYKNGTGTKISVESAEYNVQKAKLAVQDTKMVYENNLMSFNKLIGIDLDTEYDSFEIDEDLMISDTSSVKSYADKKYNSILQDKEYQLEKLLYKKQTLESFLNIYVDVEDITETLEDVEDSIEDLKYEIEEIKFYTRRSYNEKAQAIIDAFDNIQDVRDDIDELYEEYAELNTQYEKGEIAYTSIEKKQLAIKKAKNRLKTTIYNFNTKYMAYLFEMEV